MAGREVKVAILGDASSLIKQLGLANTEVGSFFTKLQAKSKLGGLALGAGVLAGVGLIGKGLYDLGDTFDEAFDKIQVGTGATGGTLRGLEDTAKKVFGAIPTSIGLTADAVTDLNRRLGLTGKPLELLAKQFLELSRITKTDLTANIEAVTGAFNAFKVPIQEQSKYLDLLFRASQATGASVGSIAGAAAKASPTMKALGFNFGQTASLAGLLENQGLDLSDVMMGFNRSLATFAKAGESAPAAFKRFIAQLKDAPDDIKANQLALEVLGARGVKFAQIVRDGGVDYQKLLDSIGKGKGTILDSAKSTNDFSENWKILKNQVLVQLEPIATKVFKAISDGMAWITAHREEFQQFFTDAGNAVNALWDIIGPTFLAIVDIFRATFDVIDDLIHGRWGQLWDDFVSLAKGAIDLLLIPFKAIGAGLEWAWDNVIKPILDAILGGIASVKSALDSLNPFGGTSFSQDELDQMTPTQRATIKKLGYGAEGAIVNRPTLALIGEAGPEALVPLNRTAGNGPLPGGGGPIEIAIYLDSDVVGRATVRASDRAGGLPIRIRAVS